MFFSRSVAVSALMGFATATNMAMSESLLAAATPAAPMAMSTGTANAAAEGMVATHVIQVGGSNGTLTFLPNNVQAAPGDLVQFQFNPKNHSVVQSTFDNPCVPIQNIMPNKTDAFFSGYMPTNATAAAAGQALTYTIRVKDEKPVWFYCSQGMHCQAGMVGAINAPASGNKTVEAFTALAANAPENLTPGAAAGSGSAGNTPTSPSAGEGAAGGAGSGTSSEGAGSANGTISGAPAEATRNAAAGRSAQSFVGLGAVAAAAFALL
ncbi:hypothetical protein NX059_010124 [Plenodomus lindquistii]|nr:hypothetical protein NX059_010124 [Plenodomus lindquistii]